MLNLILGADWTANRDAVLEMVAQDVKHREANRILMVPELISHDMERRLCAAAGDIASRYAEVLSFTRLARRVADSVGFGAEETLDNGGRVVAMAAAARQLHSKLKAYASLQTRPEFLEGLVDAVDEFKRCCISSSDLKAAAKLTDGSFAQKLEELSLIYEAYDSLCSRGKRDPRDQMTWLLEQMQDSDFGENHVFYIDGFPDFTRQHLAILEHLIQVSPNVTVSLNCDVPGSKLLAFEKAGETALELIRCAERAGAQFTIQNVQADPTPLQEVRKKLFQGTIQQHTALNDRLLLCRADNINGECRLAVQRVLELVRNGCRYRDIGIVCSDMAVYQNAIGMTFRRSGIPLYQSGTEDVLQKSVITTVLSAMEAALGGFERQDVLRYLKSVLSPLNDDMCDRIENYAVVWGVNGNGWLKKWENHPDGLSAVMNEAVQRRLDALNDAKSRALEPLAFLQKAFRESINLAQQVEALCDFFERIKLAGRMTDLADSLDASGDNRSAQILNQLWDILLTALEQMHAVLGETVWDEQSFTRLLILLLSQYDVGTIPPVLDAVVAGPVSAMRCHQVKHLIVLGVQEGALPGYSGSVGVLTDQERTELRRMGVPLTGGSLEGLQAEFAEIYGVFCSATESILVSCSAGQPSYIYRRLSVLAGSDSEFSDSPEILTTPVDAAAYLAQFGALKEAEKLSVDTDYHNILQRKNYRLGDVDKENIHKLYGQKLKLSASQVDRQADCRFSYFMRYGLRAQERKEASVDPAEFGTYVHAVLEHTAARVMELGGFSKVSLDETMELAMGYSEAYAREHFSQLDSKRMTYLLRRNVQELGMVVRELWQELSRSLFEPVDFEVAFGEGRQMDAVSISGKTMEAQLRGFVDRVDAWHTNGVDYFRVVDYKTGRKDFDYCDVFNGLGLQMLLYMFALEQGGQSLLGENPVPVGVQYFPARSPLISSNGKLTDDAAEAERSKIWKRRGLILCDDDVLNAMEPEGAPARLSCSRKKDGTVSGDIASSEQLKLLKRYVFSILGDMVDEIASGIVEPNPYTRGSSHNACSYCPYKEVCHFATVEGRRNYKAMTAERFWEEIGREMRRRG